MFKKRNLIIALTLLLLLFIYIGFSVYMFPGQIILLVKDQPIKMPGLFALCGDDLYWGVKTLPLKPGENNFSLKFLGIWQLKKTQVYLLERCYLKLGGHSVGVILESEGLKVAGFYPVITFTGKEIWPAKDAGLAVGDLLIKANGINLTDPDILQKITKEAPMINLTVSRGKKIFETIIIPYPSKNGPTNEKMLGIFLSEPVMGIGTLTFATEDGYAFAALGHLIGEGENDNQGSIKKAHIVGIRKGERGTPGEKLGLFDRSGETLGIITKNSSLGIYGKLSEPLDSPLVELAFYEEIKVGPAQIVTVLSGENREVFEAFIEQIFARREPTNRSFIIRITDSRLLAEAGGIVQGMSGSPVLQNGKLIGAVTHVFVNDPQRGYGALAEWMALEAGAFKSLQQQALGS